MLVRRLAFVLEECSARLRFIVGLLAQWNGLRRLPDLHPQRPAGRRDTQILIAESPHQVKRLLRRLLLRNSEGVHLDLCLDRRPDVRRRAEEPIRRHGAVDALMRTLEVVVLDEQPDSP